MSVNHSSVPPVPGFVRAEVLVLAHVLRPVKDMPHMAELTLISQADFKGSNAPEWCVDKWLGQQTIENYGRITSAHAVAAQQAADDKKESKDGNDFNDDPSEATDNDWLLVGMHAFSFPLYMFSNLCMMI
jgi:hypothetical protein